MIIRQAVDKISIIGRNTQGVKLIELNEKDNVYDIARIAAEPDVEEELFETLPETSEAAPDSDESTEANNEPAKDQKEAIGEEIIEDTDEKNPVKDKPDLDTAVKEESFEEEPEIESEEEIQLDLELDE